MTTSPVPTEGPFVLTVRPPRLCFRQGGEAALAKLVDARGPVEVQYKLVTSTSSPGALWTAAVRHVGDLEQRFAGKDYRATRAHAHHAIAAACAGLSSVRSAELSEVASDGYALPDQVASALELAGIRIVDRPYLPPTSAKAASASRRAAEKARAAAGHAEDLARLAAEQLEREGHDAGSIALLVDAPVHVIEHWKDQREREARRAKRQRGRGSR